MTPNATIAPTTSTETSQRFHDDLFAGTPWTADLDELLGKAGIYACEGPDATMHQYACTNAPSHPTVLGYDLDVYAESAGDCCTDPHDVEYARDDLMLQVTASIHRYRQLTKLAERAAHTDPASDDADSITRGIDELYDEFNLFTQVQQDDIRRYDNDLANQIIVETVALFDRAVRPLVGRGSRARRLTTNHLAAAAASLNEWDEAARAASETLAAMAPHLGPADHAETLLPRPTGLAESGTREHADLVSTIRRQLTSGLMPQHCVTGTRATEIAEVTADVLFASLASVAERLDTGPLHAVWASHLLADRSLSRMLSVLDVDTARFRAGSVTVVREQLAHALSEALPVTPLGRVPDAWGTLPETVRGEVLTVARNVHRTQQHLTSDLRDNPVEVAMQTLDLL